MVPGHTNVLNADGTAAVGTVKVLRAATRTARARKAFLARRRQQFQARCVAGGNRDNERGRYESPEHISRHGGLRSLCLSHAQTSVSKCTTSRSFFLVGAARALCQNAPE